MIYTYLNGSDEEVLLRPLEGVRDLRNRQMLSQQELADCAGVSLFTVQRIERGDGNVRPKTGRAIAEALGVRVEDLLGKAQAPLPDFEDERRHSLQSWTSFVQRLVNRWEQEIAEREAEWQKATPPIRKNVKLVPNLNWGNEIRAIYLDVMTATAEELEAAFWVATSAEARELFSALERMRRAIDRTDSWYSSTDGKVVDFQSKVVDFQKHLERIQRRIGARAS
jgi:transcriptional regulator with XRE-family HTH domain